MVENESLPAAASTAQAALVPEALEANTM